MKKVLASMIVLGALSSLTVGGTFAVLNSQESNAATSISSGTLTFSNVVNVTGPTCFSYGGAAVPANANTACQALFTSASENYPGVPTTTKITLTNDGSLDASDLSVFMPSCTNGVTPGAPAPGGGDPCAAAGAQLYLQETDSSFVATSCWFPTVAAGACSFVANSLFVFKANFSASTSALDLGAGIVHGQSRYFIVGMQLPSNAGNTLQGQAAQFGLTWHLTS